MRPTLRFVTEKFRLFNELCFDGALPDVNIRLSSSLRTMGSLRYPGRRGRLSAGDFVLSVSDRLDLPQNMVEDVVIHEMIHLYIAWNSIPDTSVHGVRFRAIMNAINSRFGRSVTVSVRTTREQKDSDRLIKPRPVIVCRFSDGTRTVTVCSPKYSRFILDRLKLVPGIVEWRFYLSASSAFAPYPASRTLKFYRMDPGLLDIELASAVEFRYENGKFNRI